MTSIYFIVSINASMLEINSRLFCYCGGRFMSGPDINNNHHKTSSLLLLLL